MRRSIVSLLALGALLACERHASPPQQALQKPQVPASGSEDPLDPSTGLEVSCQFSKTVAHPDPRELAGEFLRRDVAGEFLKSNPWFDGATDCPGHEPGPDSYTMVATYGTAPVRSSDTLIAIAVTYQALGEVHADAQDSSVFEELARTLVDTLTIRRTPYGWRIRSPALWLRISVDSAFAKARYRPFHAKDAQRIRDLLAQLNRGA